MSKRAWVVAAVFAAYGCASEQGPEPEGSKQGTLSVVTHTPTELEVVYEEAGTLRLRSVETGAGMVEVSFDFGDTQIVYKLDYNRGIGDFLPSGAPLDDADMRLIEGLFAQLEQATVIGQDAERTRVEDAAFRQANLMTITPTGEILQAHTFKAENGWTHIGCTCGNQYIGSGYYRTAGRGCGCTGGSGNGCKGRCGQGCGITSTPKCVGSTAYTQDCAKHDYGLGSWTAASDDYSFASNNCSCSGVGTCY